MQQENRRAEAFDPRHASHTHAEQRNGKADAKSRLEELGRARKFAVAFWRVAPALPFPTTDPAVGYHL